MHKKYLKRFTGRLITTAFFALLQIILSVAMLITLSAYAPVISAFLTAISIVVVAIILNLDKNPAYKLLWIMLILTFPVFGGLTYLASTFQSSTYLFKKKMARANSIIAPFKSKNDKALAALRKEHFNLSAHAAYLSNRCGFPLYENTEATYISSGELKFELLKRELQKAKKFIFLEYFIIQEGLMWDSILKILISKVKEGVDVRIIWDGMGCISTLPKNYEKTLSDLGIKVMIFNKFVPVATVIQNNRDHRKIVVIDGCIAFTGGINLADEYINAYDKYGHWKDAAVMLRGEAVRSFTLMFLENWYMHNPADKDTGVFLDTPKADVPSFSPEMCRGYVQPYSDTPLDSECVSELVYLNMINKAEKYIYIMTPYLIPDNELLTALCFAAKSGIDVRIMTPHIPDKWYAFQVTRSFYGKLLADGVKIYEYTPGFVHSKVVVSDDRVAVVGSVNFDYRSLYLHFECAAVMYENSAVLEAKRDFVETLKSCEEITPEIDKKIRGKHGLIMGILKVFAPLL